jgi:hypothetical protein
MLTTIEEAKNACFREPSGKYPSGLNMSTPIPDF